MKSLLLRTSRFFFSRKVAAKPKTAIDDNGMQDRLNMFIGGSDFEAKLDAFIE